MATTQQGNQQEEIDRHKRDALDALLTEQVIHILGKPAGLHKVQVRQVGERGYRVNILIGPDAASVKVGRVKCNIQADRASMTAFQGRSPPGRPGS